MRKWNAVLSLSALVLLLIHGVLESFLLMGSDSVPPKWLPLLAVALLIVHVVVGLKYTIDSLRIWHKTGAGYFQENKLFWTRRISGFVILALVFFHFGAFGSVVDGKYQILVFTGAKLTAHLLLVAAMALHIITNIRPLMVSLGVRGGRSRLGSVLFLLSVLLLFMAAAFIVYYLRWNVW